VADLEIIFRGAKPKRARAIELNYIPYEAKI
jgi:hypothetical protein